MNRNRHLVNTNARQLLRKTMHRREQTLGRPTPDLRPSFRTDIQQPSNSFHRRTISHDKTVYFTTKDPLTRNKPIRLQFATNILDSNFIVGLKNNDPVTQSLKLGQTKTTPATATISPAFTKQKFLFIPKVKGNSRADPMSTSFHRAIKVYGALKTNGRVSQNKTFDQAYSSNQNIKEKNTTAASSSKRTESSLHSQKSEELTKDVLLSFL